MPKIGHLSRHTQAEFVVRETFRSNSNNCRNLPLILDILGGADRKNPMKTVLIVDDQEIPRMVLKEFIRSIGLGLEAKVFETPAAALDWVENNPIVMAIADYRLPGMNGIEFTRRLHALPHCDAIPVVMITALNDGDKSIRYEALDAGVIDFLCKPMDYKEWHFRCRNFLHLAQCPGQKVLTSDFNTALFSVAESLNGRNHKRMAMVSRRIAQLMGLSEEACELLEKAAPLNDLGQLLVAGPLLWFPNKFHEKERIKVRHHTLAGYQLLKQGGSPLFRKGAAIALSHHEQYNGKGYPHGFRGSEIPLEARIVAVADLVDALLSNRPHRQAWSLDQVLDYLKQCRGQRLDPECVDAFFEGVEPNQLVQLQPVSP